MEVYPCTKSRCIQSNHSMVPSLLLFGTGILGNLIALFILWQHKLHVRNGKTSVFYILVTGLTIINLLGKCLVCPVVLASYSTNQTLVEMVDSRNLCHVFGFLMLFFGLAPTVILLLMALDCWLALGYPFFYRSYITKRVGFLVPLVATVFSLGLCSMPFMGFGKYEQYCPGTWCFIQLTPEISDPGAFSYSVLYGTVMGLLIIAIITCNVAIMKRLYQMYQTQRSTRSYKAPSKTEVKHVGMEELDHLVLLAVMTILFATCSIPLTVRVYVGLFTNGKNDFYDLTVLRLLSVNSIVDPWILIICRTSLFHSRIRALYNKMFAQSHVQPGLLRERLRGGL